ncbi:MAG TPA: hypothetical protein VGL38_14505 [bacterium]|jgi:hypothetical protein
MPEQTAAQIRLTSIRRFRWMVVMLILISGLAVAARYAQHRIADNYGRATLARESAALTREYTRFEAARGQNLGLFPPPADTSRREIWAVQLGDEFDQPSALCLVEHGVVTWLRKPYGFETTADSVTGWLTAQQDAPKTLTAERFGNSRMLHARFQSGDDIHSLWLFSRGEDSLSWGVLLSSNDAWIAFFRNLQLSAAVDPAVGSPAWALQDMFALPRSNTNRWNMGVRAFLNDSLIFSSSDLDTTRPSCTYDFNGRKAQCYLSSWQEISTHWRIMRLAFWPILFLPLVLIVPFFHDYRQIHHLTANDAGSS